MEPMTPLKATPWRWTRAAGLVGLAALAGAAVYGGFLRGRDAPPPPPPARPAAAAEDIAREVNGFCNSSCHAPALPEAFPRRYWRSEVERGFRRFEKSTLALTPPPLEDVIRYFEERAPEELPPADLPPPPSRPLGLRFEKVSYPGPPARERFAISNVNLVRLPAGGASGGRQPPVSRGASTGDSAGPRDILACDMLNGLVMLLRPYEPSPAWKVIAQVPHPAHTEVVDLDRDGLLDVLVADLGSFPPTDRLCGRVVWLRGRPDGSFTPVTLLENVGRVVDVQAADFRGTGRLDLIVAEFGWQDAGKVVLLENETTDWDKPKFVPRVVDSRHGAIHVPVCDLNGDGRPDFVTVFAQEHETVVAFLNDGGGKFTPRELYRGPHPGYGSSGIELVDLNRDGRLDVLYTNGDILDEPHIFKPYHNVQWLENKGDLRFEHHLITPLYGAHRAVAADFRGQGLPDVVAVSFMPQDKFPDRAARRPDAVVFLEQVAPGKFERHTLESTTCDHTTCAVGDVFGTGEAAIVVGQFSSMNTDHPVTIYRRVK